MTISSSVGRCIAANADRAIALSDAVWDVPELSFDEHRSSDLHAAALGEAGFAVTRGVAGLPTAIMAEAGQGGPVIAFLGEYDALPRLGHPAGITVTTEETGIGNGHACGHNLLGSGAFLAAVAVRDWLVATGASGRVRYYGCPAEEAGGGKGYMVREGVFSDVDAVFSWHPSHIVSVIPPASANALLIVDFTFEGRAAHAAMTPHLGRSALDGAELMNVGVNYLREHVPTTARIHYAYQDAGGPAPNIVQSRVVIRYILRAVDLTGLEELSGRVRDIAEGAALMSGTRVTHRVVTGMANLLPNPPLEELLARQIERAGPVAFDEADFAMARDIRETFTEGELRNAFALFHQPYDPDLALDRTTLPRVPGGQLAGSASTDVGDVSWAAPTAQLFGATMAVGTTVHTWQATAQGKSGIAHKGMVHAAGIMAAAAAELFENPGLLDEVRADHARRLADTPYRSPLPDDAEPDLIPRAA